MIDDTIARVKDLITKREEIDAELATIFGMTEQPRRGRPRKELGRNEAKLNAAPGMDSADGTASQSSTASGGGQPPAG